MFFDRMPTVASPVLDVFLERLRQMAAPRVLELGARRSDPRTSTLHKSWAPHASRFVGVDYQEGLDVDVLADIHRLSQTFDRGSFDAIISASTFEHVKYPWIAAVELAKVLSLGGIIFVQTHQSFPLHSHPCDYWRFTRESLEGLFNGSIGFQVLCTDYEFPCRIVSKQEPGLRNRESFLNVRLCARKSREAPDEWIPQW
jgi:hypothetical protein